MQAGGIGYDLLNPLFTPDRRILREAVVEKAKKKKKKKKKKKQPLIGMNSTGPPPALAFLGVVSAQPSRVFFFSQILAKYKAHRGIVPTKDMPNREATPGKTLRTWCEAGPPGPKQWQREDSHFKKKKY